jgi:hypothetical protein
MAAMKRITSLLFAVVSTTFLAVGAAKAAEKFDTTKQEGKTPMLTDQVFDGPALPCVTPDEN